MVDSSHADAGSHRRHYSTRALAAVMPVDCHGQPVTVGTRVRVLKIASWLERDLPSEEVSDLQSMVGEVFEVFEIDQYGQPWIEKVWQDRHSHALALDPDEMEVVTSDSDRSTESIQ